MENSLQIPRELTLPLQMVQVSCLVGKQRFLRGLWPSTQTQTDCRVINLKWLDFRPEGPETHLGNASFLGKLE